jgi:hypothetical protein
MGPKKGGVAGSVYALKPLGLGGCAVAAVALVLAVALADTHFPTAIEIAVAMGILVIAGIWLLACTANGVRQHAEAYALALFESIETLLPARRKRAGGETGKASTMRLQILTWSTALAPCSRPITNALLMIDCGHNASTGWKRRTDLRQQNVKTLDMLAVTNYDEDHASGSKDLFDQIEVRWLWRNRLVSAATLKQLCPAPPWIALPYRNFWMTCGPGRSTSLSSTRSSG